jgi:hypothetical protein
MPSAALAPHVPGEAAGSCFSPSIPSAAGLWVQVKPLVTTPITYATERRSMPAAITHYLQQYARSMAQQIQPSAPSPPVQTARKRMPSVALAPHVVRGGEAAGITPINLNPLPPLKRAGAAALATNDPPGVPPER